MTRTLLSIVGLSLLVGCVPGLERAERRPYPVRTATGEEVQQIIQNELASFNLKQELKKENTEKVSKIWEEIRKHQEEAKGDKPYEFFIPIRFTDYGSAGYPTDLHNQPLDFPNKAFANINYQYGSNTWWGDCWVEENEQFIEDRTLWHSDDKLNVRPKSAQKAYEVMTQLIEEHRITLWLNLYSAKLNYDNEVCLEGLFYISNGSAGEKKRLIDYLYEHHKDCLDAKFVEEETIKRFFQD